MGADEETGLLFSIRTPTSQLAVNRIEQEHARTRLVTPPTSGSGGRQEAPAIADDDDRHVHKRLRRLGITGRRARGCRSSMKRLTAGLPELAGWIGGVHGEAAARAGRRSRRNQSVAAPIGGRGRRVRASRHCRGRTPRHARLADIEALGTCAARLSLRVSSCCRRGRHGCGGLRSPLEMLRNGASERIGEREIGKRRISC